MTLLETQDMSALGLKLGLLHMLTDWAGVMILQVGSLKFNDISGTCMNVVGSL